MQKLFNDKPFIQKERPTSLTPLQAKEFYLNLAEECLDREYSKSDKEDIAEDLSKLEINYSGYKKAKELESNGIATYDIDGDFIDWLDDMSHELSYAIKENVKAWVEGHQIKPKLQKGTKLKINKTLNFDATMQEGCIVYVTKVIEDLACYILSEYKAESGGYLLPYELVYANCEVLPQEAEPKMSQAQRELPPLKIVKRTHTARYRPRKNVKRT